MLWDYDLDFAYGGLNGRKWDGDAWGVEGFGLLTEDYRAIKDTVFAESVFKNL